MTAVAFPEVDCPLVSVIMVVYGGWEWVREALLALIERTPPCYEVVLIDNASPDGTGFRLMAEVSGATVICNDDNVGFGAGANQGALHAVGRYVLFLNSDAFVQPGWLPPLLEVFNACPDVAAVTPRLIDPDGTLQEAGGLVAGDGFAGQFGLGRDADRLEYRFRRQVDFSSAAALMVRRRDFVAVGGFHPAYAMGYFEDVDLCLTLWDRGLATVYEPGSTVIHLRGASGTEELAQTYALANHSVLMRRWSHELRRRQSLAEPADYPHRVVASRDARAFDRVLVVVDRLTEPSRSGWNAFVHGIVLELAEMWPTVRFTLVVGEPSADGRAVASLSDHGVEVAMDEDWEQWFLARRFHYSSIVMLGTAALERFDRVLSRTQPQALLAFAVDGQVDLPVARRAIEESTVVFCASEAQARVVADSAPGTQTAVLPPFAPPTAHPRAFFERVGVVVSGRPEGSVTDLMAAIGAFDPDLAVELVGAEAADTCGGTGFESLARARVAIVAVAGSASAWTLADAVSCGVPFVTTSEAADGLDLGEVAGLVVADDPEGQARLAWSLYSDPDRWATVHRAVVALAATRFAGRTRQTVLRDAMALLGLAPPGDSLPRPGRGRPVRTGMS